LACERSPGRAADSAAAIDSATNGAPVAAIDSGAPLLLPYDDANESFRAFRRQALDALARRDTTFLYSIVAPEIRTSFGSGGGVADFKEMWKAGDPSSGVWRTLTRILQMGGKLSSDTMFTAPYVFANWPDTLDAFEHVAVTTVGAPVFAAPDTTSAVIGTATHSILRVQEWRGLTSIPSNTDSTWARVQLRTVQGGWMRGTDVYSSVGWRAAFLRREGRWIMIFFLAGD
jgi:hypothetical protein